MKWYFKIVKVYGLLLIVPYFLRFQNINSILCTINSNMNNLIIYRTWQFLTYEEEITISPNETRYFGIEKPVVDGYRCIGVSLQEKHGGSNGYLLLTYTESLMTVYNPRNTDAYFWGAIFKFVYIKC